MEKTILDVPVRRQRSVRGWYGWLLLPLLVWMAHESLLSPPPLATLAVDDATLVRPLELIHPTGKGHGGPYVRVVLDAGTLRIDNICMPFALACRLPPDVAALASGGRVRVWHAGERIWQLARPGHAESLVAYASIVHAYDRNRFWIAVLIVLVTGIVWWRWRVERQER
jgi:hypothetical protein